MNISKQIPILGWIPNYQKEWLRFDIMAGLTCAAVVLPKAMAIAVIAGLPVQTGLYNALVAMLAYAIFGASRALSVSTTATLAMMTAAQMVIIRETPPGN
jgi:SulP family sulfate permease